MLQMPSARDVLTPTALTMLPVIADTGSFAAAARMSRMVPSALTYRVRQMEEALDVLLFDRSSVVPAHDAWDGATTVTAPAGLGPLQERLSRAARPAWRTPIAAHPTAYRAGWPVLGQNTPSTGSGFSISADHARFHASTDFT